MRGLGPVLASGSTFVACTLAGLLAGIWVSSRSGQSLWVPAGLFGGLALGGYAAFRLLQRSLS